MASTHNVLIPPLMGAVDDKLRGKISNDLADLQALHVATGWTPGRDMIRPAPSVRAQKAFFMHNIGEMWASPAEWVFHHVFKSEVAPSAGLRCARASRAGRDAALAVGRAVPVCGARRHAALRALV